jgi:rhodanese-related sulfurtransferase
VLILSPSAFTAARPDGATWKICIHEPLLASPLNRRHCVSLLLLAALAASTGSRAAGDPDAVSLETARAEHEAGRVVLIDIREPEEHATGVAKGVQLLPMRQLSNRLAEIPLDPKKPVYLICNTQNRSSATLRALRQRGYEHVRYVSGGMSEWSRRGWPLVKPAL